MITSTAPAIFHHISLILRIYVPYSILYSEVLVGEFKYCRISFPTLLLTSKCCVKGTVQ